MNKTNYFYFLVFSIAFFITGCENKPLEKDGMVLIKGDGELKDFWIDITPVSVAQFKTFIDATHYITQGEKFGNTGVFNFESGKWEMVKGANWKWPFGKKSMPAKLNDPVTQVSWNDAIAYCKWAKKRLPKSEEFLFAEKNADSSYNQNYSWGHDCIVNGKYKANFWQGNFPKNNTMKDGFLKTSPVGYFGKNKLGLSDIEGNVWQWCTDESKMNIGEKNQRGGSFLCDPMVCHGFKIGGISSSTPETSLCNVGFRCVMDVQ